MRIFSQDLFFAMLNSGSQRVTVTINPYLIDQVDKSLPDQTTTVTLSADGEETVTGTGPQTITVNAGVNVTYSVTKSSYSAIQNQVITPYSNITKNVTLSNIPTKTVTITTVPADADVKITCTETSAVTNAKTASVEVGYHYTVEVTKIGLTKTTASFSCSGVDEENEHEVVMDATISWGTVTPSTATRTMSRDYTYQNPVIDEPSIKVPCTTQIVYWKVELPGYTTNSGTVEQAAGVGYLVDTVVPTQTLVMQQLHFTVNVTSPADAAVSGTIYNPNTGITRIIVGTGTTVLDCYMDEVINYTVSKTNYTSYSGSQTMGSTDLATDYITLEQSVNFVTISCLPASGTVTLSIDDGEPIVNQGQVQTNVPIGSTITYSASFAGVTSEPRTYTVTAATPPYSDLIELEAVSSSVDIITTTTTKILEPGHYYFVAIGGGASGQRAGPGGTGTIAGQIVSYYGSQGGYGGGSGYITYGNFVLTTAAEVTFAIGAGATAQSRPGDQQSGGATTITIVSNGYVLGQAEGGAGANGGSGGGGRPPRYTRTGGSTSMAARDGSNGGLGGGNGADGYNVSGGTGYYNAVKNYENNAGAKGDPATPGGGGRGVVSIQSSITVEFLRTMNADKLQTLYNSLGGGGSGGSTTVHVSGSGDGHGGGGGAWTAGSAGNVNNGKGGDGAVIIARYGWD